MVLTTWPPPGSLRDPTSPVNGGGEERHACASLRKARARCDRPRPRGGKPCFSSLAHFAESAVVAVGQKHRIVAKTLIAARRPNQNAVDAGLEFLGMAVRPGDAERRDEMRLAALRGRGAAVAQFFFDRLHGAAKIPLGSGPARGVNSGLAAERVDDQAGIVGKGGKPAQPCRRLRLDSCVVAKRHSGLVRFVQVQFACRYGVDAVRSKQVAHLGELARIMRCDHQPARDAAMCRSPHITAIFCKSTSLATPLRASAKSAENCASENGVFSAVACTSTISPEPVRTKLASVSACESSA